MGFQLIPKSVTLNGVMTAYPLYLRKPSFLLISIYNEYDYY